MNLGQLLEGQEAVAAFNKGIQLMIASKDNDTAQVGLGHTYVFFTIFMACNWIAIRAKNEPFLSC